MITDEQILELVKEHFEEDWDENDGWEYSGNFDAFLNFARAIYKMAYNKGHDDGWEDRGIAESSTYSGMFGEPQ